MILMGSGGVRLGEVRFVWENLPGEATLFQKYIYKKLVYSLN